MPTSKNFELISCQATLFTPDGLISANHVLQKIVPRWSELFDGQPIVLPPSDAFPAELPRIILENSGKNWKCEIAPARVNFYGGSLSNAPLSFSEFREKAVPFLTDYIQVLDLRVARMAAVANRFCEQSDPGIFLSRHFCQDRWLRVPLNRPENFELHAHKRFTMDTLTVNSWARSKTGEKSSQNGTFKGILFEQDINTLKEDLDEKNFSGDEVKAFFDLALAEFDKILELYYPS